MTTEGVPIPRNSEVRAQLMAEAELTTAEKSAVEEWVAITHHPNGRRSTRPLYEYQDLSYG